MEIHNPVLIEWIRESAQRTELLASVCTGALLLAQAGLSSGKKATTHWMDQDRLERDYPSVQVVRGSKLVDEGSIITSGGISAGILCAFTYWISGLVEKLRWLPPGAWNTIPPGTSGALC